MKQRIIPDLHRGIDGDSQISQNRMSYDEIEYNRNKDRERVLLTVKASPFILILNSKIQNESNLPK